ncbi:MAG: hypothetical protein KGH65_03585, partial [Candidatus Micrarchaeota archaeon]|nr:hypothetical protein [Candidatus Micrarchaeota archaeon]
QNNWLPPNPLTGLMGSFQKTRPLAAAEVGSYADVLPMLLGQRSAATDLPLTPTAAAVKEGFTVNPSFASIKGANAPFGKLMEGLGGGARLSVENAVKNANITSKIANEHLGLPETRILTPETLEELRAPHNAVYQEIDNIPSIPMDKTYQQDLIGAERTPTRIRTNMSDKIQALQKQYNVPEMTGAEANIYIKDLRGNARTNYLASKSPNVENAASLKNLAYAQNHIASAIEDQIERHLNPGQEALAPISAQSTEAPTIGNDLLQRFRNARKSLAVINTYERAIKPGTTDVIPAKLAKEYNKSPKKYAGTPVEKIAQTYNNFPHEMHDAATYRGKTPVNYGDILLAWLGKNVASGAEPHSMGAGVAAGVAGATIRPALRALLKSRAYQKGLAGLPRRNILAPIPPLGQLNGQKNP